MGMAFAFSIGGTVQVYAYRILGLDWFGSDVSPAMAVYKMMLPMFGLVFATGAGILAYDLLTLGRRVRIPAGSDPREAAHADMATPHAATGWYRPLTGFESGTWLMAMWVFGFMITFSLLSFNLPRMRVDGNPTLPHLLAGVGYPGLLLVTLGFVWRFLASLEASASVVEPASPFLKYCPHKVDPGPPWEERDGKINDRGHRSFRCPVICVSCDVEHPAHARSTRDTLPSAMSKSACGRCDMMHIKARLTHRVST